MRQTKIQVSVGFLSDVLVLCYVKIFFCKTSYKAVRSRFVISDLQNGTLNVSLLSFT